MQQLWFAILEKKAACMILRFSKQGGEQFYGRLKDINCPVLFTASLSDEMLPDPGAQICRMMQQISGSQAFLCREGNHPLMWNRPAEFRRAVDGFLQGLLSSS